jgi:hypothetical protein
MINNADWKLRKSSRRLKTFSHSPECENWYQLFTRTGWNKTCYLQHEWWRYYNEKWDEFVNIMRLYGSDGNKGIRQLQVSFSNWIKIINWICCDWDEKLKLTVLWFNYFRIHFYFSLSGTFFNKINFILSTILNCAGNEKRFYFWDGK